MTPIKYTLDKARELVQLSDYADALIYYSHFFEQTFKNPAKYGVRLSYCLQEWRQLGDIYPEALEELKAQKDTSLLFWKEENEPERFQDYRSICKVLGLSKEPLEVFLQIHHKNRRLASEIVRFIWDDLVENKNWKVCLEYLNNPLEKYQSHLSTFDNIFKKYVHDASTSNEKEIFGHGLKWFIKDITNLLLILKHNDKMEDYALIRQHITSDLASRKLSKVEILVDNKLTI